jgi:hypothetical protein
MPERFVTTHAAKHQHSWRAAEGKNSATGNFVTRLFYVYNKIYFIKCLSALFNSSIASTSPVFTASTMQWSM